MEVGMRKWEKKLNVQGRGHRVKDSGLSDKEFAVWSSDSTTYNPQLAIYCVQVIPQNPLLEPRVLKPELFY